MPNSEPVRIAVIDDDEDDYFIMTDYISGIDGKKFIVDWYKEYATALEKIRDKAYHLYFVDYSLGKQTGLELLQEAAAIGCDDPIVFLTGKGNRSIDIKAMESGATDYLIKSELNTEKLERCIRYSLDRAAFLKEIKARENKYRNLFENSKDAVFIADKDLVFIEVNQAAALLFECAIEQLAGRSLDDFFTNKAQKKQVDQLLETGGYITDLEVKLRADNNEIKYCQLSLSFQGNEEEQQRVHGIIHDITNIRKEELANLHAEKLAANERLVRMLAHEIRNPLNNICLSIDHLREPDEMDEKQKNLLAILQRNSARINQIITELLNLTRPHELVFEKLPLQEIIEESLARASDRINLQAIRVKKIYPELPLEIAADKSRLIIAFTNILINGIEAMEAKKGELAVALSDADGQYHVSIQDNGKGIPEEYLSQLFEPFFTLKKNGMGLGLASSYAIIQSHKGVVQVKSAPDKGTKFIVSFNKNGQHK